jgi:hypothetical protein
MISRVGHVTASDQVTDTYCSIITLIDIPELGRSGRWQADTRPLNTTSGAWLRSGNRSGGRRGSGQMVAGRFRFAVGIEDTFVPLLRARQFLVGDLLAGTVDDTHPLAGWLDASIELVARLRAEGLEVVGYIWVAAVRPRRVGVQGGRHRRPRHLVPMGLYDLHLDSSGTLHRVPTPLVVRFRSIATTGI